MKKIMLENPEKIVCSRYIYKRASYIIGQNKEVKLSKEVLLKLRQSGLRLIPQLSLET